LSGKTETERLALYLLGEMSGSERELLEAEYFSDDEAFQKVLSTEDDLIDAYARDELSAEHRRLFEKRFLNSAEGRERLRFARTLAGAVSELPAAVSVPAVVAPAVVAAPAAVAAPAVVAAQPIATAPVLNSQPGFWATLWGRSPALSFAVVVLAVLLIGGNTVLLVERRNLRNEMEALRAERDKLNQQAAALQGLPGKSPDNNTNVGPQQNVNQDQNDPRFRDTIAQNRVPEFTVYPGGVRSSGGGGNHFTITNAQRSIALRLVVENPGAAQSFSASIETADGAPVKSFNSLKPTSANVINLPRLRTSALPSGVYIITLQAQQPDGTFRKIGDYTFNLNRK
jgi:hypothetical protein